MSSGVYVQDFTALEVLFKRFYKPLRAYAFRFVNDKDMSEDIVQDVFVKIWETREKLGAIENLSAYLYQMVRYRCFSHLRTEKVRQRVTQSFTEDFDETEMNEYIKNETFRIVMEALEDLPPGSRNVFSRALQGYSAKEIA